MGISASGPSGAGSDSLDNPDKMSDDPRFQKHTQLAFQQIITAQAMKFHKDDLVVVISGKDKTVSGKILTVDHERQMLVVEGVNMAYKHVKPSQKNPQGGRLHKETPIRACKVMLVCPKTGKPTRIGYRYLTDGSKERFARLSGTSLGTISPAKATYAK